MALNQVVDVRIIPRQFYRGVVVIGKIMVSKTEVLSSNLSSPAFRKDNMLEEIFNYIKKTAKLDNLYKIRDLCDTYIKFREDIEREKWVEQLERKERKNANKRRTDRLF